MKIRTMKKIGIILITTVLAACTEQELSAPITPVTPDGQALIVPNATVMGMEGTSEMMSRNKASFAPMPGTRGTTRAASYPYLIANKDGKKSIIVTKDADGQMSSVHFHYSWLQTPQHLDGSKDDAVGARFEVAQNDEPGVWQLGDNTACTAPWRRPTVREMQAIYQIKSSLEIAPFSGSFYGTATETTWGSTGYFSKTSNGLWPPYSTDLKNTVTVRCVRDAYPYVTTNADGQSTVIVSQDEYGTSFDPKHAPWTVTPIHNELSTLNSVSHRFEIGDYCTASNAPGSPINGNEYFWSDATTNVCNKYFKNADKSDLGTWRLPTLKELEITSSFISLISNQWCWAATEASDNPLKAYLIQGNSGTFINNKIDDCYVRCVRDLTLALPGSSGSPSFTLTAFAGATEPTDWATPYFAATDVKATATGFEMSTPQYFPANGAQKVYFYATAPACTNYSQGSATVEPKATYSFANGKQDVMWAKDARGIAKSSIPAQQQQPSFLFQHLLKQVQFKVKRDDSFDINKTLTKITVKNVHTQVSIGVISGSVSWDATADISTDLNTPLNTDAADAATLMFAPAATFKVEAVVSGVTYPDIPVTLTGTNPGAAGTANVVTISFKRKEISTSVNIVPWNATPVDIDIDVNE